MTLKAYPPQNRVDPIDYAWQRTHGTPLPPSLVQSPSSLAGAANGALGRKGKGTHILAVCV